jgi:hypothetical protein
LRVRVGLSGWNYATGATGVFYPVAPPGVAVARLKRLLAG